MCVCVCVYGNARIDRQFHARRRDVPIVRRGVIVNLIGFAMACRLVGYREREREGEKAAIIFFFFCI